MDALADSIEPTRPLLQVLQRSFAIGCDRFRIPQISELERTRAMEVRLIDAEHEALNQSGIGIAIR